MILYLSILFLVLMLNIYSLTLAGKLKDKPIAILCGLLLLICTFKYASLYIFSSAKSLEYLYPLKHLVLLSIISLPVVSYISMRLVNTGTLKAIDKIITAVLTLACAFIIYKAPYGVACTEIGYKVVLNKDWPYIVLIALSIFSAFMIYMSLNYLVKRRGGGGKTANFLYLLGYIGIIIENLLIIMNINILPSAIISEGIVICGIIASLRSYNIRKL